MPRAKAVIGKTTDGRMSVEFDSAHDAARWLIEHNFTTTTRIETPAASITSAIKGRESRKSCHKDNSAMVRNEAYGFNWSYK